MSIRDAGCCDPFSQNWPMLLERVSTSKLHKKLRGTSHNYGNIGSLDFNSRT